MLKYNPSRWIRLSHTEQYVIYTMYWNAFLKRLLYITILIYRVNSYGDVNIFFGPVLIALFL